MEPHTALLTLRDSPSHMEAKTDIAFQCRAVYDDTIRVLQTAVHAAKLGREEELDALRRVDEQARLVERCASGPPVGELIAHEREQSHNYGGKSVFGWAPPPASSTPDEFECERAAQS